MKTRLFTIILTIISILFPLALPFRSLASEGSVEGTEYSPDSIDDMWWTIPDYAAKGYFYYDTLRYNSSYFGHKELTFNSKKIKPFHLMYDELFDSNCIVECFKNAKSALPSGTSFEDYYNIYYTASVSDCRYIGAGNQNSDQLLYTFFVVPKDVRFAASFDINGIPSRQLGCYVNAFDRERIYISSCYYEINMQSTGSVTFNVRSGAVNLSNSFGGNKYSYALCAPDYYQHKFFTIQSNIPIFNQASEVTNYLDTGDLSLATNKKEDVSKVGCDSFGWDTCDCYLVENDTYYNVYHEYTYSNEDMKKNTNDYVVVNTYTVDVRYIDKEGVARSYSQSGNRSYLLSDNPDHYTCSVNLPYSLNYSDYSDLETTVLAFLDLFCAYFYVDSGFYPEGDIKITSVSLYVTVKLYKGSSDYANYFDGLSNPDTHFDLSSNVKIFKFDLMSGSIYPSEVTPTVNTEEVKDDNGNVTDKKVTSVVGNDDGRTVVNITIDNGHEINNTNTNTNTGGSGSGSGSDAEEVLSFWDIISKLGDTIKGLFTGSSGLFSFIKVFFDFMPPAFWTVVIALIVIIGIVAIYKLVKSVL